MEITPNNSKDAIVKSILERKLKLEAHNIIIKKYKNVDDKSLKISVDMNIKDSTTISISMTAVKKSKASKKPHHDKKPEDVKMVEATKNQQDKKCKYIGEQLLKKLPKLIKESEKEAGL